MSAKLTAEALGVDAGSAAGILRALGVLSAVRKEEPAETLVNVNNQNLDIAKHLLDLASETSDDTLRKKIVTEVNRMLDNSEKMGNALRSSRILPRN
jgi:hypothetical protein